MRRVEAILAVTLATVLAGCVLRGKPKTTAAIPPVPQPAVTSPSTPPQPPPPLSIAQTQVQLPPPQPVDPDALATTAAPPEPPADTSPAATGTRINRGTRTPATGATAPKPEPAPPAVTPPPAPVEARAPIQEVVPASEQKRLQDSAQARKREILQWLDTAGHKRMNRHQQSTVVLIRGFLKDSDDAERRGDMRQADALAERAQILLRELQNGQ